MQEIETAKYEIIGLVDIFDEQRNITGQFPIGSIQEMPVEYGDEQVKLGHAKRVEEVAASTEEKEDGAPESGSLDADEDEDSDDEAVGATGEEAVE